MPEARRGVLFDIDGTLVDSNHLHALAWRRAFLEVGLDVATASIHRRIGMGGDLLVQDLVGEPRPDAAEAAQRHFEPFKAELRAFPGAWELLRALHQRGVVVVLASSARPDDLEAHLQALDADDAITASTTSGDVDDAKPAPDLFQAAMELGGLRPQDCVVVGDTVWDVQAATRAGVPCVAVLTGGSCRDELEQAGAVAVVDDVAALLATLDDGLLLEGPRPGA